MSRPSSLSRWIALLCFFLAALSLLADENPQSDPPEAEAKETQKKFSKAVVIHFEGFISGDLEQYFYRRLKKAQSLNADLIIVQIESPGGLVDESFNIADRLQSIGWAHTVAYVPDYALSGAAFVALGCDEIVMIPGARMGDAGPIFLDENFMFQHAPEKYRSDLAVQIRELARESGRPPALAEAMVDMNLIVYRVEHEETHQIAFMSDDEINSDVNPQQWINKTPIHESRKDHFLEATGARAVELRLADANVDNLDELRQRYGLEGELTTYRWGAVDTAVLILNNSFVTGLLFVVGIIALYFEFSAPGISIGGLISGLCFALFFWSHFLDGAANWLEVVLFLCGVVFLVVEMFVLPGFGVAGVAGLVLIVSSVVLACQDFVIPHSPRQWQTLSVSLLVVMGSGVISIGAAILLSRHLRSIPILNQLALRPPHAYDAPVEAKLASDKEDPPAPESRYSASVGDWGEAKSPLRPAGKARFGDEYIDVVADGAFVDLGSQIRITEIAGNRVVVRAVEDAEE